MAGVVTSLVGLAKTIPPALTFGNFIQQATGSATPIAAGVTFPLPPSSTRRIVVCLIGYGPPTGVASAVTIGGIAATIHVNNRNASGTVLTIASALVPTGASGSVQVTYPSATSNSGLFCWSYGIDGMISGTPQAFIDTASPFNQAITCAADSAIIACQAVYSAGATTTWSGTAGVVENSDVSPGGLSGAGSVASLLNSTALSGATVIGTPTNNNAAQMGVVVFT